MKNTTTTKKVIYIGEYEYDITNFKHPGGNVIDYMTSGQDATQVFEEFHYRSTRSKLILHSLPHKKIEKNDTLTQSGTETKMLADFVRFRKSLEDRGFFKPSYSHITYRIVELIAIYSFAIYTMQYSIAASIILLGLFSGRCGWVQHEGGHNSFTGNMTIDKIVQNVFIGFGLLADGSMWNSMHNKHHATTQKIGYDMDLDTAPLVLFYDNPDSRTSLQKWWLKYQAYTFLPVTSGMIVMLFWIFYLHPRKIIRDRNIMQATVVSVGHLTRVFLFVKLGSNVSVYYAICYHILSLWITGMYLFGQFSLSHTFMPVVESNENPTWVRYSLEHTVDIEPHNFAVSWVMGYLNNQVIHHLFPSMPQYRGPEVSKEFAVFCKKWDLKYNIITYREAWYYMFANLHAVGKNYA